MSKEEIIEQLKQFRDKQGKLALKRNERKRKKIQLRKRIKELKIQITQGYSEGSSKTNKITSSIEEAVIEKDEKIQELKSEIQELTDDIELLETDIEEANIRLGSLTYLEKKIITAYYVDNMSYQEIGLEIYYEVKHQTRDRRSIRNIIKKIEIKMEKL